MIHSIYYQYKQLNIKFKIIHFIQMKSIHLTLSFKFLTSSQLSNEFCSLTQHLNRNSYESISISFSKSHIVDWNIESLLW